MLLLALAFAVAALVLAAKAHGRQVRLERELAGYDRVEFGGENPPFVQALWRRDRIRFWTAFPSLLVLVFFLAPRDGWLALALVPAWAAVGAFTLAGVLSHASLLRAMRAGPAEPAWRRDALRGSAGWWSLAGLVALASVATALL